MLYSIMFIASFPFQWCKSHVCGVSGSWLMVHQWLTSHLHIVASLHFVLDNFTRSDSESDVCFCLSASCQKIADRWCHLLSLWAASPMGVGLIGYAMHIVATLMSLVMALHTSLTPFHLLQNIGPRHKPYTYFTSWWLIQSMFIELISSAGTWIRSLDLWTQSSLPYQCRHGGCMDRAAKA